MNSKTVTRSRPSQGPNSGNKPPTPNAWARPLKPRPPPGLAHPSSKNSNITNGSSNSAPLTLLSHPELRDRFLHLTLSLVGHRVSLHQVDGSILEGVFHTFTPFSNQDASTRNKYVLKSVSVLRKGDHNNFKIPDGSTVIVPSEKVIKLHCKSYRMSTANGKTATDMFRTDSEISTNSSSDKGRSLIAAGSAWTSGGPNLTTASINMSRADGLLDVSSNRKGKVASSQTGLRGNIGEWDQFRANKELFNVQAKFDENLYTTELDKSVLAESKIKEAERLAREIENTASGNIHVAEERNQVLQGDYDEEDRYSGVLTKNMAGGTLKEINKHLHQASEQSLKQKMKSKTQPKVMNYAAAAAKADAAKVPPGFTGKKEDITKAELRVRPSISESQLREQQTPDVLRRENDKDTESENVEEKSSGKDQLQDNSSPEAAVKACEPRDEPDREKKESHVIDKELVEDKNNREFDGEKAEKRENSDEATIKTGANLEKDDEKDYQQKKSSSKLNANAKAFTFNPSAKTFTPGSFTTQAPTPVPSDTQQSIIDPATGMSAVPPQMQGQPHYMHPTIAPVMPMINPHFPMRYAGGYPGLDQTIPPGQQHPTQHMQPIQQQQPPHSSDGSAASKSAGGDEQQSSDAASPPSQQQPQAQSHPTVSMPYPQTAAPYPYGGNMPIPPRGPHMGGYHPSIVSGGPQQIPVVRGGNPYGHMYGMPQHPPQMRPNSAYFPNAPPHYSHYMIGDDDYRGGGRGGRSNGRGRRGGRKSGRGRWQNNPRDPHSGHNAQNGRQNPQSTAEESASATTAQQNPAKVELGAPE